jgi:hypothetical protein
LDLIGVQYLQRKELVYSLRDCVRRLSLLDGGSLYLPSFQNSSRQDAKSGSAPCPPRTCPNNINKFKDLRALARIVNGFACARYVQSTEVAGHSSVRLGRRRIARPHGFN